MEKLAFQEMMDRLRARAEEVRNDPSRAAKSGGLNQENERDYDCPKCKDKTGYIAVRDGMEVWVQCSCIEWRRAQRLLRSSEITNDFKKLGFQNFRTEGKPELIKGAYECALSYFRNFEVVEGKRQNSIALLGQPGVGKTHLLTAIANNLIRKRQVPVLYFPYVEGFNNLKDNFDKLEEKMERMKKADVLFIDDLFKPTGKDKKPRATEWQIEQTYAVINHRYLNHMPVLISSELPIDQLVEVDEALATRIYEMCKDYLVLIQGDRFQLNHRLEGKV
ncbi:ATP-binding protein [Alteribacillus bidgolensis]|uniref:DNA replication protein DnaC n=1 Tax=Alteribacillus bidgolensis TaxID=930129 RepID=A0A1G8Q567_9BACI|nr:ATP-binding protein [Alteribacillus bidgolensis]SDI99831.1 DNA replication protein DnaC [Alteribacillus bidgolensis]